MNKFYTLLVLAVFLLVLVFKTNSVFATGMVTGTGSISGTVYLDSKCDGYDLSDTSLAGVKVTLVSKTPKINQKVKSDLQGNFIFLDLPYSRYLLSVDPDKGYMPKRLISTYEIGEANGAVSGMFVFCEKNNRMNAIPNINVVTSPFSQMRMFE